MVVKVNELVERVKRGLVASSKENVLSIITGKKKLMVASFNGTDLQIASTMAVEDDKEVEAYVKGDTLLAILMSYQKLGQETINVEFEDSQIVFSEEKGEGKLELPCCNKSTQLSITSKMNIGSLLVERKQFEETVQSVEYAADQTEPTRKGIYFQATKADGEYIYYRLFSTDSCNGAMAYINIRYATKIEGGIVDKPDELSKFSFFIGHALGKALSVLEGKDIKIVIASGRLYLSDANQTLVTINLNTSVYPVAFLDKVSDMSQFNKLMTITADIKELVSSCELALAVSDNMKNAVVKIKGNASEVTISDSNAKFNRKITAALSIVGEKQNAEISLSINKLLIAISRLKEDKVTLDITDSITFIRGNASAQDFAFILSIKK